MGDDYPYSYATCMLSHVIDCCVLIFATIKQFEGFQNWIILLKSFLLLPHTLMSLDSNQKLTHGFSQSCPSLYYKVSAALLPPGVGNPSSVGFSCITSMLLCCHCKRMLFSFLWSLLQNSLWFFFCAFWEKSALGLDCAFNWRNIFHLKTLVKIIIVSCIDLFKEISEKD